MRLALFLVLGAQPVYADASGFSGLSQEDCSAAFEAVAATDRSLSPLTLFQLEMLRTEKVTGRTFISNVQDNAAEVVGTLGAAYVMVGDLCSPVDRTNNKRPEINQDAITKDNCGEALSAFQPDLVRPVAALDDMYLRLSNDGDARAVRQIAKVRSLVETASDMFSSEFLVSVKLCRFVQSD